MSSNIRVLIVDDSSFIRHALAGMLAKSPEIEVIGLARNGEEALKKVQELSPDVMTLDIEMPGMNGLEVLDIVMTQHPLPVIMVSSLTEESAKETLCALDLGAVDFISKQLNGSVLDISKIETLLVSKVRAAAWAKGNIKGLSAAASCRQKTRRETHPSLSHATRPQPNSDKDHKSPQEPDSLIIIGASTGGPKVIQEMLEEFPSTLSSAIIVIQHMPKFFTKPFAERLNESCLLDVHEAKDRDALSVGAVLVAPGSQHLRLERFGLGPIYVRVSREPVDLPYRPSVDLAMESAAKSFGSSVIGIILTGMGNDGERGMGAIKEAGGCTLAQDEATCVVYGMPKAVVEAGHADAVVPISRMTSEMLNRIPHAKRQRSEHLLGVRGS